MKGCLFHFGQTLFKNLCRFGLKEVYLQDKDLQHWFKSVLTLALLPMNVVDSHFEICSNKMKSETSKKPEIGEKGLKLLIKLFFNRNLI
jgi:hypothetical protein